jgi:hypothetical protein
MNGLIRWFIVVLFVFLVFAFGPDIVVWLATKRGLAEVPFSWSLLSFFITISSIGIVMWFAGVLGLIEVTEATAVVFLFMGQYLCTVITLQGNYIGADGFIRLGVGPRRSGKSWSWIFVWRFGGWVIYIWPFVKPAKYNDYNESDRFGENSHVRLADTASDINLIQAETSDGIALNIKGVETRRVVNPELYLLRSPRDVQFRVTQREDTAIRSWVRSGDEHHAQQARGNGEALWNELFGPTLNCQPVFASFRNRWGVEVVPRSILIGDVGYDGDYQKALSSKRQQELLAEGEGARLFRPVKIGQETYGLSHEEAVQIRRDGLAGSNFTRSDTKTTIDVQSGGQAVNPNFAGFIGAAEAIANAVTTALGKGGGRGQGRGQGGQQGGGQGGQQGGGGQQQGGQQLTQQQIDELAQLAQEHFERYGTYPPWDPLNRQPQ